MGKALVRKSVYLSKTTCHVKAIFIPGDEPSLESTQHSSSLFHKHLFNDCYLQCTIWTSLSHIALFGIVTCQSWGKMR